MDQFWGQEHLLLELVDACGVLVAADECVAAISGLLDGRSSYGICFAAMLLSDVDKPFDLPTCP